MAAVAVEPAEMQFEAVFSELPMVLPSVIAARAIAPPIIARISAYSAAEAPESSRSMLMNVFIEPFLLSKPPAPFPESRFTRFALVGRNEHKNPQPPADGTEFSGKQPAPPSAWRTI